MPTSDRFSRLTLKNGMGLRVSYMLYSKEDDKPDEGFVVALDQEWVVYEGASTLTAALLGISALMLAAF